MENKIIFKKEIKLNISEKIKFYRRKYNLKRYYIAKKCNIAYTTFLNIESKYHDYIPSLFILNKICNLFHEKITENDYVKVNFLYSEWLEKIKNNFYKTIKKLRLKHLLTQKELSKKSGVSYSTIIKIERKNFTYRPNLFITKKFSNFFSIPMSKIIGEKKMSILLD